MRDIHCPKDIGFNNIFDGADCKEEQLYNNCYHCWSSAIAENNQKYFEGKLLQGSKANLIEILETIREEIGKEFVDLQDGSEEWRSYVNETVLSCYEIVDKHIMNLKEEPFGEITNSKGVLEQIAEEQKTLLDTTKAWSKALERGDIY